MKLGRDNICGSINYKSFLFNDKPCFEFSDRISRLLYDFYAFTAFQSSAKTLHNLQQTTLCRVFCAFLHQGLAANTFVVLFPMMMRADV